MFMSSRLQWAEGFGHTACIRVAMEWMNLLQWPAMAVTVAASWLIACDHERKRYWGFWTFLLSNALWVAWGLYSQAPALVALQFALAAMNIRGAKKTDPESD